MVLTRRPAISLALRRRLISLVFLTPALVITLAIIVYPLWRMVDLSLRTFKLTEPWNALRFVGLAQYGQLVQDVAFRQSVWISLVYTAVVAGSAFVIGLLIALLLNSRLPGARFGRALLTLPWAVPAAIAAVLWVLLFQSSFGVINYFLVRLGIVGGEVAWLVSRGTAMAAVIIASIWKIYPFNLLVILAGLQAIPIELYEAVRVDGGGPWHQFRYVTLPALRHVNTVVVLLTVVWTFREFELIFILTGGGPGRATETLSLFVYQNAFRFFDFGYASALGTVMLLATITFSVIFLRVMRGEFY